MGAEATSVGQIGLDLVVNQKKFNKQMSGIQGTAKKIGAMLASAFAVKKIVDFGKSCIELGSDLQEVQNVVDVTFKSMNQQVNDFAKSAITTAGLSETMAKRYTGTFGAMAKAFGFTESNAYGMSTALTQLAGDVASFYNITQDEAYIKLKSVFTGETESLKDLGVVMTQSALDAYALANGFGKTTAAMTEQEKVALRYQFVMNQLSAAQGDFIRTSDSWANQTRVMSLQIQSIMGTIGQGLINLFTPVIKIINGVLGKIAQLAEAFKGFTELLTGKKSESGSGIADSLTAGLTDATAAAGDAGTGLSSAADSAGNLADNTESVGNAAKKAAREMKALMGFDVIEKLPAVSDVSTGSSGGTSGGAGLGGLGSGATDFGKLAESGDNALTSTNKTLDKIIRKVKQLANLAKEGFFDGVGDLTVLDSIRTECESISKVLKEIFTGEEVLSAADIWAQTVAYNLGKVSGSAVSVGLSIADNLVGGVAKYLNENMGRIKTYVISMFDIGAEQATLSGQAAVFLADIASVLQSDAAKGITSDVISIFANGFMGITEMAARFGTDLISLIVVPLSENAEAIKQSAAGILEPIKAITGTVAQSISDSLQSIRTMYDVHIAPMFATIKQGLSEIAGFLCEKFENEIKPVLDQFAADFTVMWAEHIQPAIDSGIAFFGKLADTISLLWSEYLQPFIMRMIDELTPAVEAMGTIFNVVFSAVGDLVADIFSALSGLLDFIVDIFKADWDAAWEDLKRVFEVLWNGVRSFLEDLWNGLTEYFAETWTAIQEIFEPVTEWFSGAFQAAWDGIVAIWSGVKDWFTTNVSEPLNTLFTDLWTGIETFASDTWDNIVGIFKAGGSIFDGFVTSVKDVFVQLVNGIISGINSVISVPFKGINDVLSGIRGVNILGAKPFEWVPSITVPQIPMLAQGGFVEKNTPQLAMIGDNRHYGEIVAPEDKLQEMARMAATMGGSPELLQKIISLLETLISLVQGGDDIVLMLDGEELARAVMTGSLRLKRRYTTVEVTV